MIRRIINRVFRPDPSPVVPMHEIGLAPAHVGSSASGTRRGVTVSPMSVVKADRRAASKRARLARRDNR